MSVSFPQFQIRERQVAASTNLDAFQWLTEKPPEGSVVWAHHQTQGRGQTGNTWQAMPGQNLTFSLILYPTFLANDQLFYLSKLTSTVLRNVLRTHLPTHDIEIKWPNDMLVNRQKIAGILIENQFEGVRLKGTVIGIGLNVNQQVFPGELEAKATSMALNSGWSYELRTLLMEILHEFGKAYDALKVEQFASLDRAYFDGLYGYQEYVSLVVDGKIGDYLVIGVNKAGQLAVEEEGRIRYVNMKEVAWRI